MTSSSTPIRAALLADVPQWAYDRIARGISPWLEQSGFACSIGYCCQPLLGEALSLAGKADAILLFGHAVFTKFGIFREHAGRLLVGVWDIPCFEDAAVRARLAEARATICFNRSIYAEALRWGIENAALLAPSVGVDVTFFSPQPAAGPKPTLRLGFVGSLNKPHKRLDLIVSLMKTSPPNVEFLFVDRPGTESQRLLSDAALAGYYRSIDCLISVSDYEGGPLPPLEAAACGVPAIATPVGILPEFVAHGESGLLINGNLAELRTAVARLLFEPGLLDRLKAGARKRAEEWRWEIVAESYAAALRRQ